MATKMPHVMRRKIDRIASAAGYIPARSAIQGTIAFDDDDGRAHVNLIVDNHLLIGDVDTFTADAPARGSS